VLRGVRLADWGRVFAATSGTGSRFGGSGGADRPGTVTMLGKHHADGKARIECSPNITSTEPINTYVEAE